MAQLVTKWRKKIKKNFLRPKAQWSKMFLGYVNEEQAWNLSVLIQGDCSGAKGYSNISHTSNGN
jgi:hypothetical protein